MRLAVQSPIAGQLALREFTRCNAQLLDSPNDDLAIRVYLNGFRLRKVRIEIFMRFIAVLQQMKQVMTQWKSTPESNRKTCSSCTAVRVQWVVSLLSAMQETPTWASFTAAYDAGGSACVNCNTNSWPDYFRDKLPDWRRRVDTLDKVLPGWPF